MTQSSTPEPGKVPQTARDLRLVLRGLNYDLDAELEGFRKWRQQTQKPSNTNAPTPRLVSVLAETSRPYGKTTQRKTGFKMPSVSPLTLGAGAVILLAAGSILYRFTNSGKPEAPLANSIKSESVLPKVSTAKPSPPVPSSKTEVPKRLITPQTTTKQIQPTTIPLVPKPTKPVPVQATTAAKSGAFSTFKGYGYYYVFVPVSGPKDLDKLKAIAPGSYPRVIDGRTYMQMAAYDTDRRAQVLAGQLRQRGYAAEVKK
jgi:hypothetical protein